MADDLILLRSVLFCLFFLKPTVLFFFFFLIQKKNSERRLALFCRESLSKKKIGHLLPVKTMLAPVQFSILEPCHTCAKANDEESLRVSVFPVFLMFVSRRGEPEWVAQATKRNRSQLFDKSRSCFFSACMCAHVYICSFFFCMNLDMQ